MIKIVHQVKSNDYSPRVNIVMFAAARITRYLLLVGGATVVTI